jgi:hypothetical protein
VYGKTADDGITKSKQLKSIFDAQLNIICKKISFKNLKDAFPSKTFINIHDSGVIIIVCICKFTPVPMPRSADNPK